MEPAHFQLRHEQTAAGKISNESKGRWALATPIVTQHLHEPDHPLVTALALSDKRAPRPGLAARVSGRRRCDSTW